MTGSSSSDPAQADLSPSASSLKGYYARRVRRVLWGAPPSGLQVQEPSGRGWGGSCPRAEGLEVFRDLLAAPAALSPSVPQEEGETPGEKEDEKAPGRPEGPIGGPEEGDREEERPGPLEQPAHKIDGARVLEHVHEGLDLLAAQAAARPRRRGGPRSLRGGRGIGVGAARGWGLVLVADAMVGVVDLAHLARRLGLALGVPIEAVGVP